MDPRTDPSLLPHGPASLPSPPPATVRRRLSLDEDFYYLQIMTDQHRRPSHPPPYPVQPLQPEGKVERTGKTIEDSPKKPSVSSGSGSTLVAGTPKARDMLPAYSSSIELEGIFMRKHEIEETTKRAEDRRWHATYITLTGTALNLYTVKKNRTWGKTKDGPTISPDNPPWMRKGKLEKSYSLLYADAGIAADYKKRRYVIRVRAETDQFLLSCIELSTFNKWLEGLFAAIDVALPIDDRDFPRDMSIPRMQRVRWYRGISPTRSAQTGTTASQEPTAQVSEEAAQQATQQGVDERPPSSSALRRRSSSPEALSNLYQAGPEPRQLPPVMDEVEDEEEVESSPLAAPVFADDEEEQPDEDPGPQASSMHPPRLDPAHRLSTSEYPNVGVDPHSGKWVPEHRWSTAHDLLYAKLCYSNLLFRSPRKSNFIISEGKKWYVDWKTGRMVRVLPPAYGETYNFFGPWQTIHTENRHI